MATNHGVSDHHEWAGNIDTKKHEDGSFYRVSVKGERAFHPYTHKKSQFEIDQYGKVVFTDGRKVK